MLNRICKKSIFVSKSVQSRYLNLHEFQSKKLLSQYGCATEFGLPAKTIEEVKIACEQIDTEQIVVKAQILAGGRGKGTFKNGFQGGVHVTKNAEEAVKVAEKMLGQTLVTKQTGEKGLPVNQLFITETKDNIKRELYVALTLDRKSCCPLFVACAEGGMGIEELAAESPEKIKKMLVNPHDGLQDSAVREFVESLGFTGNTIEKACKQIEGIYNLAKAKDATMVEINPLVELSDGEVYCLDAKLQFDDNAFFRHPEIWKMEDHSQKDIKEVDAEKYDLNYIALDGNVGCLVNGAGLAMATMDMISLHGEKPANFLDVGGSAKTEQITKAFEIITSDKNVKVILVNIFGGIMRCDVIAEGIVEACQILGNKLNIPVIVRLKGSMEDQGKSILENSGFKTYAVDNLDQAASLASKLIRGTE